MWKFGFLAIACILALTCLWVWYVEIFVLQRLIEKAAKTTALYSSDCDEACADLLKAPEQYYESKHGLACRRSDLNDAHFEVCHRSLGKPLRSTNGFALKQNQLKISIKSLPYDYIADAIIEVGGEKITASDRDVSITSSNSHIFLCWVYQSDSPERDAIFLKVIDARTGKDLIEKEIFSKNCCMDNMSISYDRRTSKLLFAWNDWSYADDRNLFYGILDVKQLMNDALNFTQKQLAAGDKWDKRNPYFLKDSENTYLAYATGDHWGWLSYSGRQSIGVCALGDTFVPTAYHIVASENPVGKALEIKKGFLYYEVLALDASHVAEIKKMPLNKMFAIPLL